MHDPEDRTGLAPGSNTVTVTDAGGCTDAAAFTITEPDALNVTGNVLDVTITNGSDGSIDVSVSGGTGLYTYDWADLPGSNDPEDRTNLPAGDYTVTVTDANGCTHDKTFTVNEPQCVCTTPAHVTITNLGGDMIQVCWDAQDCATGYIVQYQWKGHSDWNTVEVSAPDHCATIDLKNHLVVYVKVATICSDGSTTNYSTVIKYKYIEPCLGGCNLSSSDVTSNSAKVSWTPGTVNASQRVVYYVTGTTTQYFVGVSATATSANLTSLLSSTSYSWKVKGACWSNLASFTTGAQKMGGESLTEGQLGNISVYPNPAHSNLFVNIVMNDAQDHDVTIQLVNMMGQIMMSTNDVVTSGSNVKSIQLGSNIPDGIYQLRVVSGSQTLEKKIVISND